MTDFLLDAVEVCLDLSSNDDMSTLSEEQSDDFVNGTIMEIINVPASATTKQETPVKLPRDITITETRDTGKPKEEEQEEEEGVFVQDPMHGTTAGVATPPLLLDMMVIDLSGIRSVLEDSLQGLPEDALDSPQEENHTAAARLEKYKVAFLASWPHSQLGLGSFKSATTLPE